MGGGGGGGFDVPIRNFTNEWRDIHKGYGKQLGEFNNYVSQDPILSKLYQGAADYFSQGPSPILKALQGQGLDYLTSGPSAVTRGITDLATRTVNAGPSPISQLMQRQALEDLRNRGALTPALNRDVRNETLATAGNMGMGFTPGTLGTELLNREKYREQREQIARQYGGQAEQVSQADLASRLGAGQVGQGAEISDIASRFGIGGQVQGLTQADIAQRYAIPLSVASSATQNFGSLTNPILAYLGNMFAGNQTAQTAGMQASSQAAASNKAGMGQLGGAAIGAAGAIAIAL